MEKQSNDNLTVFPFKGEIECAKITAEKNCCYHDIIVLCDFSGGQHRISDVLADRSIANFQSIMATESSQLQIAAN